MIVNIKIIACICELINFIIRIYMGLGAKVNFKKTIVQLIISSAFLSFSVNAADLIIKNANVFDGTGSDLIEKANIIIEDGKVKEISTGKIKEKADQIIDAKGKTVMPGIINSHLHLFWNFYDLPPKMPATNDKQAEAFINGELSERLRGHLEQGITSILSPIDFWPYIDEVKKKVESGEISGPRVFMAGPVLLHSGDYYACGGLAGAELKWCDEHVRLPIDTPEQARASMKKLIGYNTDVVVYDGVTNLKEFNPESLKVIVEEAHKHNLKVLVHNADAKNVPEMIDAGVDAFIHPPSITKDTDGRYLEIVGEKKIPIAITLGFLERYIGLGYAAEKDKNDYEILKNNVQVMLKAGAIPLFTSDVPGIPPKEVIPMVTKVMKGQGIDNKTILLSATKEGANALGAKDLGTLEKGKIADLIIVDGNPLKDISVLQKVKLVVKDGVVVVDHLQ